MKLVSPTFTFSVDLNTCLCAGGFVQGSAPDYWFYYFIKDVYSNKFIYYRNIMPNQLDKAEAFEKWDAELKKWGLNQRP